MRLLDRAELAVEGIPGSGEASFAALFQRHWTAVYGVLYRLVGTREEAEDLAQEVFLKLYQRPPGSAGSGGGRESNLGGWLYRVATNLGLNAIRARTRREARQERAARLDVSAEPAPTEVALAAEERASVREILATLPERQQVCLVLRHEGLSYTEIAAALDVAPGSVGTLLARAEAEFKRRYLERREGMNR